MSSCAANILVFDNNTVFTSNRNVNAWEPAACFFKPQSSFEVAVVLRIVTTLRTTFAVRGAGHNPNPGFSSVGQGGIVLDMAAINQLTFSADKSTVTFGPGNTWDKIYGAAAEFNLTVAGGRVAKVGVGGLLLGGKLARFDFRLLFVIVSYRYLPYSS